MPQCGCWQDLEGKIIDITHFAGTLLAPVTFHAKFKVQFMTFNVLHRLGLRGLKDYLLHLGAVQPLSPSAVNFLWVLPSTEARVSIRERALSVVASLLWDSLPRKAHLALSLLSLEGM